MIRAAGFRSLAAELGDDPAVLAHRYALSLDVDTLVLGVKNRQELAACVAAAETGPLSIEEMAKIDRTVHLPQTVKGRDGLDARYRHRARCARLMDGPGEPITAIGRPPPRTGSTARSSVIGRRK